MTSFYKRSLANRITKVEKILIKPKNPVLITDLNNDGTFGPWKFNEQQLDQYANENGYDVVFIDDID
ncbi:hypothetical protein DOK76_03750 [Vagococcus sp. DIV0080]|uniref:Uncharacterized protein n=1 Tax=Candidatus Vagococcus giribetii TaxID=2230876 RepID=A0ABS3HQZ8_9ENTE|nr:hypothetical protein [Vagococcus sp. DIV0080]MBO0476170.1 hypothetical protein [Vagococcus sp. DIV0080]